MARGRRVQDAGDRDAEAGALADELGALLREVADADDMRWGERRDDLDERVVAGGEERLTLGRGQLLGDAVGAALLDEGERAVVGDEGPGEEPIGAAEQLFEEPPQALAGDLGATAREALDRALGVLRGRYADGGGDADPIAYGGDLAKRDAGLHHAERARVHADEEHATGRVAVAIEVDAMGGRSVDERVVDDRDRGREREAIEARDQVLVDRDERREGGAHGCWAAERREVGPVAAASRIA